MEEFSGGATIDEGDLTIGGITSRVIRGSHPVQNRHGEDVGVLAVYINTKAIDETTDALMFWVFVLCVALWSRGTPGTANPYGPLGRALCWVYVGE